MPRVNPKIRSAATLTDTPLVTTTEAVGATVVGVSNQSVDGIIRLTAYVAVTGGTNTTFATVRIRRGNGITGTIVGESNPVTLTGAAAVAVPISAEDIPGEVGGVPYSVTVQLTAASANGAINYAGIQATS